MKLELKKEHAIAMSDALSDILCWLKGFKAAGDHNSEYWPPNTQHHLIVLNAKMKEAIELEEKTENTPS